MPKNGKFAHISKARRRKPLENKFVLAQLVVVVVNDGGGGLVSLLFLFVLCHCHCQSSSRFFIVDTVVYFSVSAFFCRDDMCFVIIIILMYDPASEEKQRNRKREREREKHHYMCGAI